MKKLRYMLKGTFKDTPWKSRLYITENGMDRALDKIKLDPDYSNLKRYAVMDIGKVMGEIVDKKPSK